MSWKKFQKLALALLVISSSRSMFVEAADTAATQPSASWSKLPSGSWPQLVLTNEASFEGHSSLNGASSFLMKMPDGEIVLGTAKHLVKEAGGVNPPIALTDLDHTLKSWKSYPRTKTNQIVEARGVVERTSAENSHDWLLLHLAKPPSKLPATPLIPRIEPVRVGEKVFLVGVPYTDRRSAQNVYRGVVTARPKPHYFTFEFKPPIHISGFSGAPIVDEKGLLVGHGVSMSENLKQEGGLEVEFGGEDSSLAILLWQHRADGPATRPAEALHLNLPEGWEPLTPPSNIILKRAQYPALTAYVQLIADLKIDFNVELRDWAGIIKAAQNPSRLSNLEETDLRAGQIGDRPTMEYEFTGELNSAKVRYRIIMFECNECFCGLWCWTTPSHWDEAQPKFDTVVKSIR